MNTNQTPNDFNDLDETRVHILVAGRELLLAARGALKFCSEYVESSGTAAPNLVKFFKKAMIVADDLSAGLKNMDTIKKAASAAIQPIFTTMENELAKDLKVKKAATRSHNKQTHTARSKNPVGK